MSARTCLTMLAVVALPGAALAQPNGRVPAATERVSLSGPRFGITYLGGSIRDDLEVKRNIKVGPVISQFGWQFERQFLGKAGGIAAVNELVLLVGGLEQGTFLPSASWLVGLRTPGGSEFGIGPNVTPAGFALAIAAGVSHRAGALTLPFNVAVVPSKSGVRVSVLAGWTMR